jgi:hypothetical protein
VAVAVPGGPGGDVISRAVIAWPFFDANAV